MRSTAASRVLYALPLGVVLGLAMVGGMVSDQAAGYLNPGEIYAPLSPSHPLGAGEGGVDILSLVAVAEVRAIALATTVALAGLVVGTPLGVLAALYGGRSEKWLGRACDLVQSLPSFLLALVVLSSVRTPSRIHLALVFSATAWAPFARLSLAEGRVLRGQPFVQAALALGRDRLSVALRHMLPNVATLAATQAGATAAAVVVSEAALAFVGLGPGDGVSLGGLLDQGALAMIRAPHVLIVASVLVFATSASLLLAGRAVAPARHV
jgi:peptide/nickel transport system permease protein